MFEVGIAHQNNYDIDQPDIINLRINKFSSTLYKWRDLYPTGSTIFANILVIILLVAVLLMT